MPALACKNCLCVPSPQSKSNSSGPRRTRTLDRARCLLGTLPPVPRKVTEIGNFLPESSILGYNKLSSEATVYSSEMFLSDMEAGVTSVAFKVYF